MTELTKQQLAAMDGPDQPAVAVDPRTGQRYRLIRQEVYDAVRGMLKPFGRNWDNPADDDLLLQNA
ncbi:MAG TPA: hypothetical protein VL371_04240 [Gemmataceae bacterium]|jgi:hypothetical protein|nr:hypothetical protein [Gemmataceae bacterium]